MAKKTKAALKAYDAEPMRDGDVALLIDDGVCLEIEGLANHWDAGVRRNLAAALGPGCARVVMAVARPGRALLASDHVLWAELREELLDSGVELDPLHAVAARKATKLVGHPLGGGEGSADRDGADVVEGNADLLVRPMTPADELITEQHQLVTQWSTWLPRASVQHSCTGWP